VTDNLQPWRVFLTQRLHGVHKKKEVVIYAKSVNEAARLALKDYKGWTITNVAYDFTKKRGES